MTNDETSRLAGNVLQFCRTLRAAGVPVGPAQVLDALRAVVRVGVVRRDDVCSALRAVLIADPAHFRLFEQTFHIYFRNPQLLERLTAVLLAANQRSTDRAQTAMRRVAEALSATRTDIPAEESAPDAGRGVSYSARELLRSKDFEEMSLAEQRDAKALLRADIEPLCDVRTRRFRVHARGDRVDLRRSMRLMIRNDGQLLKLVRRRRRLRPPVLVFLCDISGSMSRYSRMFLHFAHVMTSRATAVHSFVFGTRLTNVTRRLANRDADAALALVANDVQDWDGGTRIAECLQSFNAVWGRRVLAQNATVILLSDGLERDTGADLEFQMQRLRRSCRRLVWLNPMLRYRDFAPKAFGIRAMLPNVDLFLPAHNVDSLAALGRALSPGRKLSIPRRVSATAA